MRGCGQWITAGRWAAVTALELTATVLSSFTSSANACTDMSYSPCWRENVLETCAAEWSRPQKHICQWAVEHQICRRTSTKTWQCFWLTLFNFQIIEERYCSVTVYCWKSHCSVCAPPIKHYEKTLYSDITIKIQNGTKKKLPKKGFKIE